MKFLTFFLLIGLSFNLIAQQDFRQFGLNDSTEYVLNNDTTIIVARNKLYYKTIGGTTLFHDFSTADSIRYVRDFDIISDSVWLAIIGRKYWGGSAILYKTTDKGISWVSDTSFYNVTKPAQNNGFIAEFDDLYQLQKISSDTLILFISYYQAGIFYSIDGGNNWNLWFANLPANYRGLFECETDYFLWGLEGDGFPASMFKFSADLLLSPDTNNVWTHWTGSGGYHPDCYNAFNPNCIYAPNSMTGYDQYLFFKNYIDSVCQNSTTPIINPLISNDLNVFPNPSIDGKFTLQWNNELSPPIRYKVFNFNGQLIRTHKIRTKSFERIDLSNYPQGLYFLVVEYADKVITQKIIY